MVNGYTYPGVYVEEIPSGIYTISGVSTSVTAFAGWTVGGPVNSPRRVRNFPEFVRIFGGLNPESELSYAVRQFFVNGGSEAWIVRIAANVPPPAAASAILPGQDSSTEPLYVEARDAGEDGNTIEVRVDYDTPLPDSTFNLTFVFNPRPEDPSSQVIDPFPNLSMNPADSRYVERMINGVSRLVKVKSKVDVVEEKGRLVTAPLSDVDKLVDDRHKRFMVQMNELAPVVVTVDSGDVTGTDDNARLQSLCDVIQAQLQAHADQALKNSSCTVTADNRIQIESGAEGINSRVRLLPAASEDLALRLRVEPRHGARVEDAAGKVRPAPQPQRGRLTSGSVDADNFPDLSAQSKQFDISLDGQRALTAMTDTGALPVAEAEKRAELAERIQKAVRALRPTRPAYVSFSCIPDDSRLVLISGTAGAGSSVRVTPASQDDIAVALKLVAPEATLTPALANFMLTGGQAQRFDVENAYPAFVSPGSRGGLYALDDVERFNLLCLPGITNRDIIDEAQAYCDRRRAFLIVDPPKNQTIEQIEEYVVQLPKTRNGALYYPWIEVADPLNNGRPRFCAPSGTVAGVYARTDSERGVWKAPAGIEANLVAVRRLERTLTDEENGTLNVQAVNCLRTFTATGVVAWGARTLKGSNDLTDEYKYVPVRRLALYIEESLYRGLKWVVFEPNDEPLWGQIRLNVGSFMQDLFRQGAFQGKTPREAYLVKCDTETTTQSDINNGIVNILVQFAPLRPAEFVVLRIQQKAGQLAV